MAQSQNGWPAIGSAKYPPLHKWRIPTRNGIREVPLRRGSAGFLLCHFAMWWDDSIERVVGGVYDDWGWAYRDIRGYETVSNHASGTALDINATQHPLGTHTLTAAERAKIKRRMTFFSGTLRHGAFYNGRVDEMHVEINAPLAQVERKARKLLDSDRGKRLLKANPGQRAVILS